MTKLKVVAVPVMLVAFAVVVLLQEQRARRLMAEAAALREQIDQAAPARGESERLGKTRPDGGQRMAEEQLRELRPLVIARKISFGSQSEQGAQTRETLMSDLHALRKRADNVFEAFKGCLDALAEDEQRDPYKQLFDWS